MLPHISRANTAVPLCRPRLSPSATICLACASISCCYGNGCFQGNS